MLIILTKEEVHDIIKAHIEQEIASLFPSNKWVSFTPKKELPEICVGVSDTQENAQVIALNAANSGRW